MKNYLLKLTLSLLSHLGEQELRTVRRRINSDFMPYHARYICPTEAGELIQSAVENVVDEDKYEAVIEDFSEDFFRLATKYHDASIGATWDWGRCIFWDFLYLKSHENLRETYQ